MQPSVGFGAPTAGGQIGGFWDLGFGDKVPAGGPSAKGWAAGFGDKSSGGAVVLLLDPNLANGAMPDCGGEVLQAVAPWKVVGGGGPYRVQMRDTFTGALWPQDAFGCWSGRFGQGTDCTPSKDFSRLPWVLPPLPPGKYDVVISWGPGWAQQAVMAAAVLVIWRGRGRQTWSMRSNVPPRMAVGPRNSAAETLLGS